MKPGGWQVRYFCNGWSIFHLLRNKVRKKESFLLLTDTPAIRIFMYFVLQKKMLLGCCVQHLTVYIDLSRWMCHFMDHWKHSTMSNFEVAEGKSWKNGYSVPDQFTFCHCMWEISNNFKYCNSLQEYWHLASYSRYIFSFFVCSCRDHQ
jgi:hypothetical protein